MSRPWAKEKEKPKPEDVSGYAQIHPRGEQPGDWRTIDGDANGACSEEQRSCVRSDDPKFDAKASVPQSVGRISLRRSGRRGRRRTNRNKKKPKLSIGRQRTGIAMAMATLVHPGGYPQGGSAAAAAMRRSSTADEQGRLLAAGKMHQRLHHLSRQQDRWKFRSSRTRDAIATARNGHPTRSRPSTSANSRW